MEPCQTPETTPARTPSTRPNWPLLSSQRLSELASLNQWLLNLRSATSSAGSDRRATNARGGNETEGEPRSGTRELIGSFVFKCPSCGATNVDTDDAQTSRPLPEPPAPQLGIEWAGVPCQCGHTFTVQAFVDGQAQIEYDARNIR